MTPLYSKISFKQFLICLIVFNTNEAFIIQQQRIAVVQSSYHKIISENHNVYTTDITLQQNNQSFKRYYNERYNNRVSLNAARKQTPMPIVGYDAKEICDKYDRNPLVVGWRLNILSLPLLGKSFFSLNSFLK